jgi:hypothetical protein
MKSVEKAEHHRLRMGSNPGFLRNIETSERGIFLSQSSIQTITDESELDRCSIILRVCDLEEDR